MIYATTLKREPFSIKKETLCNLLLYIVVLISFLFSKTVFFGIIMRSFFQWIFYFSCIFSLIFLGGSFKTLKKNIIQVAPLFILFVVQFLQINSFSDDGVNTVLGLILTFFSCCCFAASIKKELFQKYYLITLTAVCIISLLCFLLTMIMPDYARQLAQSNFYWENKYEYSWFYTWGSSGSFYGRNAGPFWEPGAFQGFIFLGLFIIIGTPIEKYGNDDNLKLKRFQLVIYFVTLLTTQSTTAYIMLILFCVVFYRNIAKLFAGSSKHDIILYILVFVAAVVAIAYIILSNNISEKFNDVNSQSASIRFNDLINSINLVFSEQGLFGYGPTSNLDSIENQLSLVQNSVGLLSMTYTYGILFGLYYIVRLFLGVKNFYASLNGVKLITVFMIYIVLHMTEGLWNLPIYILILMSFKEDRRGAAN